MTQNDLHKEFANLFGLERLKPFLYLLSKKLSEGQICIDLTLDYKDELEESGLSKSFDSEILKDTGIVADGTIDKPFVLWKDRLYMQRYFKYETSVYERIKGLIECGKTEVQNRKSDLESKREEVKKLFPKQGFIDWQLVAALSAVLNQFTIITGGPGTGKTTTVAKILKLLYDLNPDISVALAAPTGKAAARMAESLKDNKHLAKELAEKLVPSTIHRLLGSKKGEIYFRHNSENQLSYDLIVVDESSMIDVALLSKLLEAVKPETRLILLGDKDQLASVEAGSLFGDLCLAQKELNLFSKERLDFINGFIEETEGEISNEYKDESNHLLFQHVIELRHSYRFSGDEGIGKLSQAVIENDKDSILNFYENKDDLVTMDEDYSEKILDEIVEGFKEYIEEKDIAKALKKLNKARVLCAVREGKNGVYELNKKIERKLVTVDSEFYENRPIMVTSNNYELGLFNGDTGIVRTDGSGNKRVYFETSDGGLKSVLPSFLENVETVFAMTIHKSQGSEFDNVLVVLPDSSESKILTRELLYTGITRAKEKVTVMGSKEVVLECAERRVERSSGIKGRF